MRRRPARTISRFILVDLWRLVLLTGAILVTVLSFAAAVRFLHDGRIGPIQTLKMMVLAMPPMLQYALPFAAGFGATLAYHRMCTDNEVTACHAGGVSHRSLLLPALVSGVVLGAVVLSLSNQVIPRFLRSMEEMLTRDATRFIIGAIERKEAVPMDDLLIYADLVSRAPDTSGGKYEQLYLKGVFVVRLDKEGNVLFEGSALEADVWLMRRTGAGDFAPSAAPSTPLSSDRKAVDYVIIKPHGLVGRKPGELAVEFTDQVIVKPLPIVFRDDPKYLSWKELAELRNKPERSNVVDQRRRRLAACLAERATTETIRAELQRAGEVRLLDGYMQPLTLRAADIAWDPQEKWWVVSPLPGSAGVEIERTSDAGRIQRQVAQQVWMRTQVVEESPDRPVSLVLNLGQVAAAPSAGAGPGGPDRPLVGAQLRGQTLTEVSLADDPASQLAAGSSSELLSMADARVAAAGAAGDEFVGAPRDELRRRIADLMREITSKQHERLASSAACLVMVLTGAVMAMRLRSKLPLTVYLWAFFPALAAVISIAAGQQMVHKQGMVGMPVLWGGVGGLLVYAFSQYRVLARH